MSDLDVTVTYLPPSLHEAFTAQAKHIVQENTYLRVSLESQIDLNLQAMESISQLHTDKAELLEGLKVLAGGRFDKLYGDWSEYRKAKALIAKHSKGGGG